MSSYVYPFSKMAYIKGDKPDVSCVMCAIIENDPKVESLIIKKDELVTVMLNLYPYTTGHLMIVPNRHVGDLRNLTDKEEIAINTWTKKMITVLESIYTPSGFNVGYNLGEFSGGSVDHLHMHIVPRFKNELGFIDIVAGSRVIVEDPKITQSKIIKGLDVD